LPPKSLTKAQFLEAEPSAKVTDLIWIGSVPRPVRAS